MNTGSPSLHLEMACVPPAQLSLVRESSIVTSNFKESNEILSIHTPRLETGPICQTALMSFISHFYNSFPQKIFFKDNLLTPNS